jgi:uncharacterized Rmd1/YagE family protein
MGIMVSKDLENNSELNRRISSDLRARTQAIERRSDPDFEEDSAYIEDTKKTGKFTWVWIVLIVLAVISLISILFL